MPLSSKIQELVHYEQKKLISNHIDNWLLGFKHGKFQTKHFDGRDISYEGVKFEGSPREVFLNDYIEPFLFKSTDNLIDVVSTILKSSKLNPKPVLSELGLEVIKLYDCVYKRMAYVDRCLMANGNPSDFLPPNFTEKKQRVILYLNDGLSIAETSFPKPSVFFEIKNHFKKYLIAYLLAGIGSWLSFLLKKIGFLP